MVDVMILGSKSMSDFRNDIVHSNLILIKVHLNVVHDA